jgi:hypothetical protein
MQIGAEALVALVALVVSMVTLVKGERMQRALQKSQSEAIRKRSLAKK